MINIVMDSQLLTALMTCPRLADFRFNKSLVTKKGKSNSLEVGSIAHTILEFYYKSLIAEKPRNDAIEIGFAAGREYLLPYKETNKYIKDSDHKGVVNTPQESGKYEVEGYSRELIGFEYVFKTMQEYFDFYRNDTWTPLAVEEVRQQIIYSDDEIRILWKAKYDLISDTPVGILSMDHKTMSQRRDTLSLNNQFTGQCKLLGSSRICINKIGWQKSLRPEQKFERSIMHYSPDRVAEWCYEIVPYYARMLAAYTESNYFPPNFNGCEGKYGRCNYKGICEADRNLRDDLIGVEFEVGKVWDPKNE